MNPLGIDLFCGLGGWSEALLAEGWDVVGFDITRHVYGEHRYPARLVLQDVLMLHGSQLRDASLIVASPPCQFFSYTGMPWSRAKALAAEVRADPVRLEKELALFKACFRLQGEACEAAGRHIPLIVENVRNAQPWVGRARFNFGSYYLWGDVPALMPVPIKAHKVPGFRFDGSGGSFQTSAVVSEGFKSRGLDWRKQRGIDFTRLAGEQQKLLHIRDGADHTRHLTNPAEHDAEGIKARSPGHYTKPGSGADWFDQGPAAFPSGSTKRKAASALIAKIPEPLARHIARVFRP